MPLTRRVLRLRSLRVPPSTRTLSTSARRTTVLSSPSRPRYTPLRTIATTSVRPSPPTSTPPRSATSAATAASTELLENVEHARAEAAEAAIERALEHADHFGDSTTFPNIGPLEQYDRWVAAGKLRDDPHQRGIVKLLQGLHEKLQDYHPPKVVHPSEESLTPPEPEVSFFQKLMGPTLVPQEEKIFHGPDYKPTFWEKLTGKAPPEVEKTKIPENMPKGLYLYGDVGSGKTMLMDMFYSTLPSHLSDKKERIHFHHFMQDVHKRLHKLKLLRGPDFDAVPYVAAELADEAPVLCFDEFQCTDVADAMILRRLLTHLMEHGVVMVSTSNRHPDELYRNGIQRASFLPCIELLKTSLDVICLDSPTDYRKLPRPASHVYHHPLDASAQEHANKWFEYFAKSSSSSVPVEASEKTHIIWGRPVRVPKAKGQAAMFPFQELCGAGSGKSAADYLELCRHYSAFVVTDVPGMDHKSRDMARRFITFLDAAYESRAKLVMTMEVPLSQLFVSKDDIRDSIDEKEGGELDAAMRNLMDDLGLDMKALKNSSIFSGDEERFAFARAFSRLSEMGSREWVEREI